MIQVPISGWLIEQTYIYLSTISIVSICVLRFIVAAMHHKGENLAFIAAISEVCVVLCCWKMHKTFRWATLYVCMLSYILHIAIIII